MPPGIKLNKRLCVKRVSYSGSTGVSKTSSGGSIPSTRAKRELLCIMYAYY